MRRNRKPRNLEARLREIPPGAQEAILVLCERLFERFQGQPITDDDAIPIIRDLMWEGAMPPELGIDLIRQIKASESPLGPSPRSP
jgi:hypothetical protein